MVRKSAAIAAVFGFLAGVIALVTFASFRATGQGVPPPPPGLAAPTPTPDTSRAVGPEEAISRLSTDPNLGRLVSAVQRGDVEALLGLIDWQPTPCGSPQGSTDLCPAGVAQFTELPMVDVGDVVPFWVTAETLRPTFELLLAGTPLVPRVATRLKGDPNVYYIAFAGPTKGSGLLPLADPSSHLTGLFFVVDPSLSEPILRFSTVSEGWRPTAYAYDLGIEDQEIIVWDAQY